MNTTNRAILFLIVGLSVVFFFNFNILYQSDPNFWLLFFVLIIFYFFVNNVKISSVNFDLKRKKLFEFIDNNLVILFVLIIISAVLVRLWNLDLLSPAKDEFAHLIAGKRWLLEGSFNYDRGWEISYMVGFLSKLFKIQSIYVARLVPVFWGSMTIFPIYLLGKEFGKRIGLIAAFLWAFSPFAIGISRYIREYAFYLFLVTFGLWVFYQLRKVVREKKIHIKKKIFIGLILVFLLAYPIVPEVSLTYAGLHLMLLAVLAVYSMRRGLVIFNKYTKNKFLSYLLISLLSLIVVYFLFFSTSLFFKVDIGPWQSFFATGKVFRSFISANWYSYSAFPEIILLFIFLIPLIVSRKDQRINELYGIFFSLLIAYSLFYHLLTDDPFGTRTIYFLYPIFIIIMSISADYLIGLSIRTETKKVLSTVLVIIMIFIFNPLLGPSMVHSEVDGQIDLKQRSPHKKTDFVAEILNNYGYQSGDTVITTHNGIFSYYFNNDFVKDEENWPIIRFKYHSQEIRYDYPANLYLLKEDRLKNGYRDILKIINSKKTGWIVTNYQDE